MSIQQTFGKYTVVQQLGAGGMAEVFLCRMKSIGGFDKPVVIKRILPAYAADPEFVRMFLDEARVAAGLNHPNVIHCYDIDEVDGVPYLAMEYVPGPTLTNILKTAKLASAFSIPHAVGILRDVCSGLHAAHNAVDGNGELLGLVHRDVSPHNILVSVEGVPKLLDFGVAKSKGRLSHTQAGTLKGKLSYIAPEQVKQGEIDGRADVYSIGVCLYLATTGRLPYHAENDAALLMEVLSGDFPSPSELVPDYPPELERIIRWAMAAEPEARCPNALALHDALEAFGASGPYASNPAGVARWIAQLFPPGEPHNAATMGAYGLTPSRQSFSAGPRSASESSRSKPGPPVPDPAASVSEPGGDLDIDFSTATSASAVPPPPPGWARRRALLAAVGGAGLLLAVGGYVVTRGHKPPSDAAEVGPSDVDASARAYLGEANRLVAQHQLGMAGDMLAKAREHSAKDSALNIEIARLGNTVERDSALEKARQHLAAGDPERATELANVALSRDPSSSDAVRILDDCRRVRASQLAVTAAPPAGPAPRAAEKPTAKPASANPAVAAKPHPAAAPGFDSEGMLPSDPDSLMPPSGTR